MDGRCEGPVEDGIELCDQSLVAVAGGLGALLLRPPRQKKSPS